MKFFTDKTCWNAEQQDEVFLLFFFAVIDHALPLLILCIFFLWQLDTLLDLASGVIAGSKSNVPVPPFVTNVVHFFCRKVSVSVF